MELDRAIGCLLGQALGDALGTMCEFYTASDASEQIEAFLKDNDHLSITGHLGKDLYNAQITDDTEMALALARSLIRCQGYDPEDVAHSYLTWIQSDPFDVGKTTSRALLRATDYQSAVQLAARHNAESLSNGSLMRSSILGIAGLQWTQDELCQVACIDCQMTHPHPLAQEATCAYVSAIKTALETGQFEETFKSALVVTHKDSRIHQILMESQTKRHPLKCDSVQQGYLGVTLSQAFYEVKHESDFNQVMLHIMQRGGDTDTNCAVAGALFGALHGYEVIPTYLVDQLLTHSYNRESIYPWGKTNDLPEVALILTNLSRQVDT